MTARRARAWRALAACLWACNPPAVVAPSDVSVAQPNFSEGESVQAMIGLDWYPATVLGVDPSGSVHVEVKSPVDRLETHVAPERLRRSGETRAVLNRPFAWSADPGGVAVQDTTPLLVGQSCVVRRGQRWHDARVEEVLPSGGVTVSYEGFTQWREEVNRSQMRVGIRLRSSRVW